MPIIASVCLDWLVKFPYRCYLLITVKYTFPDNLEGITFVDLKSKGNFGSSD